MPEGEAVEEQQELSESSQPPVVEEHKQESGIFRPLGPEYTTYRNSPNAFGYTGGEPKGLAGTPGISNRFNESSGTATPSEFDLSSIPPAQQITSYTHDIGEKDPIKGHGTHRPSQPPERLSMQTTIGFGVQTDNVVLPGNSHYLPGQDQSMEYNISYPAFRVRQEFVGGESAGGGVISGYVNLEGAIGDANVSNAPSDSPMEGTKYRNDSIEFGLNVGRKIYDNGYNRFTGSFGVGVRKVQRGFIDDSNPDRVHILENAQSNFVEAEIDYYSADMNLGLNGGVNYCAPINLIPQVGSSPYFSGHFEAYKKHIITNENKGTETEVRLSLYGDLSGAHNYDGGEVKLGPERSFGASIKLGL